MAITVNPTNAQQPAPQVQAPAQAGQASAPAGVAAQPTTMQSAAPASASTGCCPSWISSAVEWVRNLLSKIPLIGKLFERTPVPVPQPGPGPQPGPQPANADATYLTNIKNAFPSVHPTGTLPVIDNTTMGPLLQNFSAIQGRPARFEAFAAIANGLNATADSLRQFFNAMPADDQSLVRYKVWELYTQATNSTVIDGVDQGDNFGNYIVTTNYMLSPLTKRAAQTLAQELAAAAPAAPATV